MEGEFFKPAQNFNSERKKKKIFYFEIVTVLISVIVAGYFYFRTFNYENKLKAQSKILFEQSLKECIQMGNTEEECLKE